MAKGYIPVNRDQQFLLPPDMREWLPKDHFVWWLLDVLARLDTKELHRLRRRGAQGRSGYDPDMLLALLVYAYTHKVRSSREIERLCWSDIAFRVICAGGSPDHTTIARFRQDHAPLCEKLFAQVLGICARAGLAQVGVVALDGTKVAANASKSANRSRAQLEAEIKKMFAEAEQADKDDDERYGLRRGDELPEAMSSAAGRQAALEAALASLREREAHHRSNRNPARWAARAEFYEAKLAGARHSWAAHQASRDSRGAKPRLPEGKEVARLEKVVAHNRAKAAAAAQATNKAQVNLTDPDSRLMATPAGWAQAYNAQAVVNRAGVILAADVFSDPNDQKLFKPMVEHLAKAEAVLGAVGVVLADAGYCSEANLAAPGPTRLIATQKSRLTRAQKITTAGPAPAGLGPRAAMEHVMRTPEGRSLYKQRSWTVEPSFGNLKHNLAFARFSRRGRPAARAEWQFISAVANLLKLFRYYPAAGRLA